MSIPSNRDLQSLTKENNKKSDEPIISDIGEII